MTFIKKTTALSIALLLAFSNVQSKAHDQEITQEQNNTTPKITLNNQSPIQTIKQTEETPIYQKKFDNLTAENIDERILKTRYQSQVNFAFGAIELASAATFAYLGNHFFLFYIPAVFCAMNVTQYFVNSARNYFIYDALLEKKKILGKK